MLSTERRRRRRWRRAPSTRAAAWRRLPGAACGPPSPRACVRGECARVPRASRAGSSARAVVGSPRARLRESRTRARVRGGGGDGGGAPSSSSRARVLRARIRTRRHLLISNASHMYNERNRLTRQVSRAPLAPRAPRHRRVLSRPHKRVVLVERAPVRLGTLHEFSHRVVPLEPVRFRGPEQHV